MSKIKIMYLLQSDRLLGAENGDFLVPMGDSNLVFDRTIQLSRYLKLCRKMTLENLKRIINLGIEKVEEIVGRVYPKELI